MVGTSALDAYQKEFLSRHCWSTLGQPTSLCEGKVYLEVRRDPRDLFINAEVIGADFGEADQRALFQYLDRVRRTTATRK